MLYRKKKVVLCPDCGQPMYSVNKQVRFEKICRYRLCENCKKKYVTIEKDDYEHVLYQVGKKLKNFI